MEHARSPGCRLVHELSFWNLQARWSLYSIIDLSSSSRRKFIPSLVFEPVFEPLIARES
jgi:hypothetical protein